MPDRSKVLVEDLIESDDPVAEYGLVKAPAWPWGGQDGKALRAHNGIVRKEGRFNKARTKIGGKAAPDAKRSAESQTGDGVGGQMNGAGQMALSRTQLNSFVSRRIGAAIETYDEYVEEAVGGLATTLDEHDESIAMLTEDMVALEGHVKEIRDKSKSAFRELNNDMRRVTRELRRQRLDTYDYIALALSGVVKFINQGDTVHMPFAQQVSDTLAMLLASGKVPKDYETIVKAAVPALQAIAYWDPAVGLASVFANDTGSTSVAGLIGGALVPESAAPEVIDADLPLDAIS